MAPMDEREQCARRVCAVLSRAGHRALLAGGCVRDKLLGVPPKDYDVATSARVDEIRALFPGALEIGAAFGVMMLPLHEGRIEITCFRRDGPYLDGRHPASVTFTDEREDALRRDFTINAMFLDPENDALLDYVHGQEDLRRGIVRAVGDPRKRFQEDYLRMARAARFAGRLGFAVDTATLAAIREHAPNILRTSPERIRDELTMMLTEGGVARAFSILDDTGLLGHVLPEIAAMKGVEQPPDYHPEGDVFTHTLLMLEQLEHPSPALAWAVLLHDVGKPPTQTFDDRIRFNFHHKLGARMTETICRRFRMPNAQLERIAWLVENHMRLADVPEMRESRRKRFVREPGFPELMVLCRMDAVASHGDLSIICWIEEYLAALVPESVRPAPLLTGHDLIAMGYAPGPLFREILCAVEDAQLEGTLQEARAAKDFVRQHWPLPG